MLRLDLSKRIALVACDYGRPAQCFPLATQVTKLLTFGQMMGQWGHLVAYYNGIWNQD